MFVSWFSPSGLVHRSQRAMHSVVTSPDYASECASLKSHLPPPLCCLWARDGCCLVLLSRGLGPVSVCPAAAGWALEKHKRGVGASVRALNKLSFWTHV